MNVGVENGAIVYNLIVGHLVIEGVENKKNRSGRLDKTVDSIEKEVKENVSRFLSRKEIEAYKKFIHSSDSVIQSEDSASEILTRLILEKGHLPSISRAVDSMNVVSVRSGLTISMWDADKIIGDIEYRMSQEGEKYHPFMGEEVSLLKGELIASDDEKVLCLVRYRDSQYAPVTLDTKNIVVHIQGVHGINKEAIETAVNELEKLLLENIGGSVKEKKILV